ncbi:MAG: hypothetical protein AAGL17_17905 [Cyanobacteria bacterium J06576_12]
MGGSSLKAVFRVVNDQVMAIFVWLLCLDMQIRSCFFYWATFTEQLLPGDFCCAIAVNSYAKGHR